MTEPTYRRAIATDLPAIVAMLADDELGATREDARLPLDPRYLDAFASIDRDPDQLFVVAEQAGAIVGCLQITIIPGLSRRGALRGLIESVRIAAPLRGQGLGRSLMEWAIAECRRRGCTVIQLTTDKRRRDARRFYESLGFVASHEGMKLLSGE